MTEAIMEKYLAQEIERKFLVESTLNPRKSMDKDALADLMDSVKRFGIMTPLIVRRAGQKYEVLAGSRRLAAAILAGLETLPCRIVDVSSDDALNIAVVENLQRADIHPLEEAWAFQEILDGSGGDMAGLCNRVGKKAPYVEKRLSLLKLVDAAKKIFLENKMTEYRAMTISRLQPNDQKTVISWLRRQDMTDATLRAEIAQRIMMDLSKVGFDTENAQLNPKAGPCSTCPKRTKVSTDLFSDIQDGDHCTDFKCFEKKAVAHIDSVEESLQKAGEVVFRVCDGWMDPKMVKRKNVLNSGQWKDVKDDCEHKAKGIVITGAFIGIVKKICSRPIECKVHGYHASKQERTKLNPKEQALRKKERQKTKLEQSARWIAFRTVYENAVSFDDVFLEPICMTLFDRLWHIAKVDLFRALGWEIQKSSYGAQILDVAKAMKKDEAFSWKGFLYAIACAADLNKNVAKPTVLQALGKSVNLDWEKVFKEAAPKPKEKKAKAKRSV